MVLAVPLVCIVLYQAPTTPLTGIVVGPNGEPVAGAAVLLGGLPVYDQVTVARGRSDAQGRFTIDRPAGLAGENRHITPILWVVKPGFRLGSSRFPGPLPKPDEPVRVVLGPPGKGEVRVEDPDGLPVAGARIRLEWFGPERINVPEAVEDLIEATTDKDGRAVIEAASNEEIAYVNVHAKGFGIQGRPFRTSPSQPKRVRLRQVGSLEGRLQADDPAMARGWQVLAYTYAGDRWSADPPTTGFARGTTDAEGRYSFPAIAPGSLQLVVKPPGELPVMADVPDSLAVVAGRPSSAVVPLHKAVTITGVVRERDTGRPVPGAEMHLSPARGGMVRTAKTDARGRYTFSSPPGTWHVSPSKLPPTLIRAPGPPWKEITLSEGQAPLELEPWDAIPAAPPLRFIVRDEHGRPAAHARINGQSASHYMPETTDDNGEFAVPGLPPGSEVSIEVRLGERMTDGPVKAFAGTADPVRVTIVPGLATRPGGPRGRTGRGAGRRCRGAPPVPREGVRRRGVLVPPDARPRRRGRAPDRDRRDVPHAEGDLPEESRVPRRGHVHGLLRRQDRLGVGGRRRADHVPGPGAAPAADPASHRGTGRRSRGQGTGGGHGLPAVGVAGSDGGDHRCRGPIPARRGAERARPGVRREGRLSVRRGGRGARRCDGGDPPGPDR